jgi:aerotaxis receptor
MPAKPNVLPIDQEVTFQEEGLEARGLITRTDLHGIITYASKAYRQMTKYDKNELIGKPHSIVRHPDMPAAAFKQMWDAIKADNVWEGYVKNLRKDGKYYWVIVRIEPLFDEYGKKIGYTGLRREPDRTIVREINKKYKEMLNNE